MKRASSTAIPTLRWPPDVRVCPLELRVLREVTDYQGDRPIVGSTLYDAAELGRQATVWTLSDGEHLILLMVDQRYCYWAASSEALSRIAERAIGWLSEPPLEHSDFKPSAR